MRRAGAPPRLCAAALIALLALGISFPAAANAAPARFVYEVCDSALPGGSTPGVSFSVNPGVALSGSNTCAQPGGSLGITETGHVSGTYSYWNVPIAIVPGGEVETLTLSGQACLGAGTVAFAYERGWPTNCGSDTQHISHSNPWLGIWIYLGCDGSYAPGCEAGRTVSANYIAATEVDPVAPTLSNLGGTLLGGGMIRGHQGLGVEAHDEGGGLSNVSVSVNGLPAAQPDVPNCNLAQVRNPSVIGTVAVSVTPCPTALKPSWTLDTEAFPFHDGANSVQVCASDFSTIGDPNTTCSATQTVNVDNSCTASSVAGGEVLSAQFAGSNSETVTVGYGKGADVTGRLADNGGDPIPGATLCVKMQTAGIDPRPLPVGTVKTDANGGYTYQVPPGPDREVVIGYRHDSAQVAREVRYYAHAQPSLQLSPARLKNGHRIRLWGQVPGPNGGGRVVVLQANVPGSKRWITFRKATTGAQGDFHSGYRFTSTTRTTTYRFRAVVPAQAGYPWVEGASSPAKVLVRG
ncbi:MAG TPA: hypothetical protein VNY83_00850 [Solirubrobacterales bacterium]|nr:hypothetical protein [Solirubrobacterales bacterium]